ncbi:MAG TPA: MFS transporter [Pirellulales bacterium]|nr:MFS transporter [Pirellulales bacterium]
MKLVTPPASSTAASPRWYQDVSRYQWLVLLIASAGWVFDVYEGQIFNTTRADLLGEMIVADSPAEHQAAVKSVGDAFLGIFLAGGMVGGVLFGALGDRWGRKPAMILTILMYSVFSGLTYFATSLWQVGALRFLVSMGVGGEWAVGAALVADVFPGRARAQAASVFQASSTLGTWLAGIVALAIGAQWRYGYLVGVLPALLILFIRSRLEEPAAWKRLESAPSKKKGSLGELFGDPRWRGRVIGGILLATVGLATFWGVTVAGQELAKEFALRGGADPSAASSMGKFAYGLVQATGGGIGLLAFGPVCQVIGRKRAFVLVQLLGMAIVPFACFVPRSYTQLLLVLPFYGAFTLAIHAGYAVYFPELFPARLRALGSSVCFNGGRIVAAFMLPLSGYVKGLMALPQALSLLSLTFLLGLVVIAFMPETKGRPLPEEELPS